jgi:hypothetical protein
MFSTTTDGIEKSLLQLLVPYVYWIAWRKGRAHEIPLGIEVGYGYSRLGSVNVIEIIMKATA